MAKRYNRLNPLDDASITVLPFTNMSADPEQQHFADSLTEFFPDSGDSYLTILLANAYARSGDVGNGLPLAGKFIAEHGEEAPAASVFALAGETERARLALETVDETAPFVILDSLPAAIILGNYDRALDLLELAVGIVESDADLRYSWLWRLHCNSSMQKLAGNPRYEALLERLGLLK